MLLHLVARARPGRSPLRDPRAADHLWRGLREMWPDALAACLMPDHVHLILATRGGARAEAQRLGQVLGGLSRKCREGRVWEPVPWPAVVPNARHLLRTVRYVHLNPCRDGLAGDPLAWPWSTHRGLVGAEFLPWVTPERLARELGVRRGGFAAWMHRYVSSDPSVRVDGTPLPRPSAPRSFPAVPLADIADAVRTATPWSPRPTRRQLFVLLAHHQGWRDTGRLAAAMGVTRQHVWRLGGQSDERLLTAGVLCLGDERLRRRRAEPEVAPGTGPLL